MQTQTKLTKQEAAYRNDQVNSAHSMKPNEEKPATICAILKVAR